MQRLVPVGLLAGLALAAALAGGAAPADQSWPNFGNDKGAMRFSPLKQIDRGSVARLRVAWTFHTRDSDGERPIQCTPIVVDGVMYVSTVQAEIAALDPATGREKWRFKTGTDPKRSGHRMANRGVAYWSDGKPGGLRRILMGTPDGRLVSVDAATGRLDEHYGPRGIEVRDLVTERPAGEYLGFSAAPTVYQDLVFLGPATNEGYGATPGDVFAFHVPTGKLAWRFHVIPEKGEFGSDTWENGGRENCGGANPWNGFTLDEKRGVLFCATGSATGDFYGGKRLGANLFANCVLALDARTGKRLWHFQTVHHDLWDWDNASQPLLCTVRRNGKNVDAVAQLTKRGLLFLLDRVTGEPLFPVREVPALASEIQGEKAWPTQPEPVKPAPYSLQIVTESDLSDITPETKVFMLEKFRKLRRGRRYEPPTPAGTVAAPGYFGGSPWSGGSFDPRTHTLYFNVNEEPAIIEMNADGTGGFSYQWFRDQNGYPGVKPPWGKLIALDLDTGEYRWTSTLGEFPELTAKGIPPTGTPNIGGTLVTAGGLVFVASTKDSRFRAFDSSTGKVLWQHELPAPGYAAPCTYTVNGRQYVVIAAGGGTFYNTKTADAFVAFALTEGGPRSRPSLRGVACAVGS
jgi:quinoprotein glucose dehydrogenase